MAAPKWSTFQAKPSVSRMAIASGKIQLQQTTIELITDNKNPKGDVFAVARIAGIQAAKRTAELIPLCHTLPLSDVKIDISVSENSVTVQCTTSEPLRKRVSRWKHSLESRWPC